MNVNLPYLLSIITFLPLVGALVVAVVPGDSAKKWLAFLVTLLTCFNFLGDGLRDALDPRDR